MKLKHHNYNLNIQKNKEQNDRITSSIIHCHFTGLEDNKNLIEQNNAVCLGTDTVVGDKFATIDTFISPSKHCDKALANAGRGENRVTDIRFYVSSKALNLILSRFG